MENNLNTQIKKKELNGLLTLLLGIIAIVSVVKSITSTLSILKVIEESSKYLAFIPLIGTIINAFIIFYFILYKKTIVGVWLFFGMCLLSFIVSISIDEKNFGSAIGFLLGQIVFFSLLLLIRQDGESAWKTLNRKDTSTKTKEYQITNSNEFNDQAIKPIWSIITYILTGILFILMIIAIISSL